MELIVLEIEGLFGIAVNPYFDERGKLQRVWDDLPELKDFNLMQSSFINNPHAATLRGIHYQKDPGAEKKIVQCVRGEIFDVVIDIRPESRSKGKMVQVNLGENSELSGLIIPPGCAHGYLTLTPNSDLIYFMDEAYLPDLSLGIRWDDPRYSIEWPLEPLLISAQDSTWPLS